MYLEQAIPRMGGPLVSVVIPTYNRTTMVRQTLAHLARQTLPADKIEVCLVDDGSTDDTQGLSKDEFPFALSFLQHHRQGATEARNAGARASHGQVLVFLDDDIWPETVAVETLVQGCLENERTVMLGTLLTPAMNP